MTPPKDPPRRQPSRPDAPLDQQPERAAVRHSGVDGVPQALPAHRKGTLPGGLTAVPLPATKPAPPRLPLKQTWRVPTPPSAVAQARRSDPPPRQDAPGRADGAPDDAEPDTQAETPSARRGDAEKAELRRQLFESNRQLTELARQARVQAEQQSPASHWPPETKTGPQRSQSPVPSSGPAGGIRIEGPGGWKLTVPQALVLAVLAAAGVGGGITAVAKPGVDPKRLDAIEAKVDEAVRIAGRVDSKVNGVLDREPQLGEFVDCLYDQQREYFEQLLPSQERLVTGELRRVWVDRCRNRRPKR